MIEKYYGFESEEELRLCRLVAEIEEVRQMDSGTVGMVYCLLGFGACVGIYYAVKVLAWLVSDI